MTEECIVISIYAIIKQFDKTKQTVFKKVINKYYNHSYESIFIFLNLNQFKRKVIKNNIFFSISNTTIHLKYVYNQ